jgi:hypothetical protein
MDPAWPEAKKEKKHPASGVRTMIASIVTQQQVVMPYWDAEENIIMNDVLSWVAVPLKKGAEKVIVSTQQGNWPDPKKVEAYLTDSFPYQWRKPKRIHTAGRPKKFYEYQWVIRLQEPTEESPEEECEGQPIPDEEE